MAVTVRNSTQADAVLGVTSSILGYTVGGPAELQFVPFDFTQVTPAGDANSTQKLNVVGAGKRRVVGVTLITSAFGSGRTLDVGVEAHTKTDGATAVDADPDALVDGADVATAATTFYPTNLVVDTNEPVMVYATVLGNTIPVNATIQGGLWVI